MGERNVLSVLKEGMQHARTFFFFFFFLICLSTCGAKGKGKERLKSQ